MMQYSTAHKNVMDQINGICHAKRNSGQDVEMFGVELNIFLKFLSVKMYHYLESCTVTDDTEWWYLKSLLYVRVLLTQFELAIPGS